MKWLKDFREFAVKGNVVDMAVGIIVGTAFGKIVSSLVKDIIMPPIGLAIGGIDFSNHKILLKKAVVEGGEVVQEAVSINIGIFLQSVFDFLIIALTIFFAIRIMNSWQRKADEAKIPEVPTPKDIQILSEIRDLLKEQKK